MRPEFIASRRSVELWGIPIPGAEDRQHAIPGFDQRIFSASRIDCVGAGGIISMIAPTLVRKGIGGITLLDDDVVETSNLNRQLFYPKDFGRFKAVALAENLRPECIAQTLIRGIPMRLEEAIAADLELDCDVAICGVDNNPARVTARRYFRSKRIPVIFAAVSVDGDHGYVFVQDKQGACLGCVFPDMVNDDYYPCPGTPAVADILQAVGSLAIYAVDTLLMNRPRTWNYRRITLSDAALDGGSFVPARKNCGLCSPEANGD